MRWIWGLLLVALGLGCGGDLENPDVREGSTAEVRNPMVQPSWSVEAGGSANAAEATPTEWTPPDFECQPEGWKQPRHPFACVVRRYDDGLLLEEEQRDARGNLTRRTRFAPDGSVSMLEETLFSPHGPVTRTTKWEREPLRVESWRYDLQGRLAFYERQQDGIQRRETSVYRRDGRLDYVEIGRESPSFRRTYEYQGGLLVAASSKGCPDTNWYFSYHSNGAMASEREDFNSCNPGSTSHEKRFAANGELLYERRIGEKGSWHEWHRHENGRLTRTERQSSTQTSSEDAVGTFTYDAKGRRIREDWEVSGRNHTGPVTRQFTTRLRYACDSQDLARVETDSNGDGVPENSRVYVRDASGNLLRELSTSQHGTWVTTYDYGCHSVP